jgi:hypothetical protein
MSNEASLDMEDGFGEKNSSTAEWHMTFKD